VPARVSIERAGVDALVVALELVGGVLPAPVGTDEVAWWSGGVAPGEVGPAVLVGHVDSKRGPAVFYELTELEAGDEVRVEMSDGSTEVFEVTRTLTAKKDAFPTEEVYGATQERELRLITCTGEFDRASGHYEDNLVVFAEQEAGVG
jgi:LPXTG-site transpeptidase (sortase) family protein